MSSFVVKDSGVREEFNTGSRRDTQEGKSRPDLIWYAWLTRASLYGDDNLGNSSAGDLSEFAISISEVPDKNLEKYIAVLTRAIIEYEYRDATNVFHPPMLLRLGEHLAKGAVKYGEHNWRLGQPIRRFYQSMVRHLLQYFDGQEDEDHFSAALFGLMGMQYMISNFDYSSGLLEWGIDYER